MKATIKEMIMSYNSTEEMTKAFSDLWAQADREGFYMEFDGDETLSTLYEDWYIESAIAEDGQITFTDKTDAIITFHKTGDRYTDIELVDWDFDPLACFRKFKIDF